MQAEPVTLPVVLAAAVMVAAVVVAAAAEKVLWVVLAATGVQQTLAAAVVEPAATTNRVALEVMPAVLEAIREAAHMLLLEAALPQVRAVTAAAQVLVELALAAAVVADFMELQT
jgi:hypothetical protein